MPLQTYGEDRDGLPDSCFAPTRLSIREALRLAASQTPLSEFRCLYAYAERYAGRNDHNPSARSIHLHRRTA